MSQKWHRSRRWDDENIPSWAWPVKAVLRTFSSVWLAVILLSLVVVYAILASVPIGLLALAPTYILYGLTLVAAAGGMGLGGAAVARMALRRLGAGRGVRFAATMLIGIGLALAGGLLWWRILWPALNFDPTTGQGVRLFTDFVKEYRSTTLRRLPGLEMSELEFYSWWPLRLILITFVVNLVTATVRRIEFAFPNIGVITVHTGIVTIALGSIYYKGLKEEGDTILLAGAPGPDGRPTVGPPQDIFYDNTQVSLYVDRGGGWEQRSLPTGGTTLRGTASVPRYNDYNLGAVGDDDGSAPSADGRPRTVLDAIGRRPDASTDGGRTLNVPAAFSPIAGVDDLAFRIVGYAAYAEPATDWLRVDPATITRVSQGQKLHPVRFASLRATKATDGPGDATVLPMYFMPDSPLLRVSEWAGGTVMVEYTRGMSEARWSEITAELPEGVRHALAIEVPGASGGKGFRAVFPAARGAQFDVGDTGYKVEVKDLAPRPPFPIITKGYEDATSSVAIVRITTPDGASYDRWVYHRFPEISQDLLDELNDRGMPRRRDADPAIRIGYVDGSCWQTYFDERDDGTVRACIRRPGVGGAPRIVEGLREGGVVEEFVPRLNPATDPKLDLVLGERWDHSESVERPGIVPESERRKDLIGTHEKGMLAVEVSWGGAGGVPRGKRVVWLPFTKYIGLGMGTERDLALPDGRRLRLAFGRRQHTLPGFAVQLADFQMISYDHRGSPRDYQSVIRVIPTSDGSSQGGPKFEAYEHVTKLNSPLQAPFEWSDDRSWFANAAGRLASRLSPRQFKFSQAGWDAEGWRQTQAQADAGQLPRPFASFTILGVGNNPGIHLIALGGIMMSVGIPWAFYIKPLIMKRRKAKVQKALQEGTYRRPAPTRTAEAPPIGVSV